MFSEAQLLEEFQKYDSDGDGVLTTTELQALLQTRGVFLTESDLQNLVNAVDGDGNGTIEIAEFTAAFLSTLMALIQKRRRRRINTAAKRRTPQRTTAQLLAATATAAALVTAAFIGAAAVL